MPQHFTQAELLAALRALLDTQASQPERDLDPAGYIISKARTTEEAGEEMTPADKDLAYALFKAAFQFKGDAEDED